MPHRRIGGGFPQSRGRRVWARDANLCQVAQLIVDVRGVWATGLRVLAPDVLPETGPKDGQRTAWTEEPADALLGDGTTTNSSTPVAVPGITGALESAAEWNHACVRLGDGTHVSPVSGTLPSRRWAVLRFWRRRLSGTVGGRNDGLCGPPRVTGLGTAGTSEVAKPANAFAIDQDVRLFAPPARRSPHRSTAGGFRPMVR
jgi:hypothetical protein